MPYSVRTLFLLVLLACLLTTVAFGQTTAGTLNGRVTDPQGAVAPGTKVTAVNLGTGIERSVTTGGEGTYSIINLQPGS